MHRKSLLRLLHAPTLERKQRGKQRGRSYGSEVEKVVLTVWESLDSVCAERLTPVLVATAEHVARFGAITLNAEVRGQLSHISEATVERLLHAHRAKERCLPQKTAERAIRQVFHGNVTSVSVPLETVDWSLFDFVGVDLYRETRLKETFGRIITRYFAHHKPVIIDEFGCCTY